MSFGVHRNWPAAGVGRLVPYIERDFGKRNDCDEGPRNPFGLQGTLACPASYPWP